MQIRTLALPVLAALLAGTAPLRAQSTGQTTDQPSTQTSTQTTAQPPAAPERTVQADPETMETMNISKVAPIYPPEAKNAAIEGDVVLSVIVDEKGKVKSADVLSGPEILRDAAVTAVKQWRYAPFIVDEAAVKVSTVITIHFKLSN